MGFTNSNNTTTNTTTANNSPETIPNKKNKPKIRKPRIKKPKFSLYDVRVLEDWFATHSHYPYPTSNEKHFMSHLTGLTKYQVSRWFCNARTRRAPLNDQSESNEQNNENCSNHEDSNVTIPPTLPPSLEFHSQTEPQSPVPPVHLPPPVPIQMRHNNSNNNNNQQQQHTHENTPQNHKSLGYHSNSSHKTSPLYSPNPPNMNILSNCNSNHKNNNNYHNNSNSPPTNQMNVQFSHNSISPVNNINHTFSHKSNTTTHTNLSTPPPIFSCLNSNDTFLLPNSSNVCDSQIRLQIKLQETLAKQRQYQAMLQQNQQNNIIVNTNNNDNSNHNNSNNDIQSTFNDIPPPLN